jgi:prepilin-type processing-associated H-X9-DG protein
MYKLVAFPLALALAAPLLAADAPFDPDARAKAIAPYLDDQTILITHADLTRVDTDALLTQFTEIVPAGTSAKEIAEAKMLSRLWVSAFRKAGGKDIYLVFSLADLSEPRTPFFAIVPLQDSANARAISGLLASGSPEGETSGDGPFRTTATIGKAVFAGEEGIAKRLQGLKATARPEVAKAFAAAGDTTGQMLVLPTADNRKVIEELLPMLPQEIGGGSSKVLTRGFLWAAIGAEVPPKMALRTVIQSQDAATAQAFSSTLATITKALGQQKQVRRAFPKFDQVAALLTPAVAGDRLTVTLDDNNQGVPKLLAALKPSLEQSKLVASRMQCVNNLKQIALSMHIYHDRHNTFPAVANFDNQGKPLLSWRVHLLPFMDQMELYKEFHLNEPWDSEHNKKLIPRMPKLYRCPEQKVADAGKTTYLAVVGDATMFTGGPKGIRIFDVTDGTSNTIFIVDATDEHAVIWTKPEDLKYDPQRLLVAFLGHHEEGFNAAFVDGSVRFLQATIDPKTLQALFTRNGGEVIRLP